MASVLVIGGTGLLGYHTVQELLRGGHKVTILALPPLPCPELLRAGVDSVLADLGEMSDSELRALLKGRYAVFYATGADERVVPRAPAYDFYYRANVLPTQRVARLARQSGVERFILYGSYTAHFADTWPDLGYRTRNGYPRTRLLQEEVAFMEGGATMDVMTLRLPYIFGTMPGRVPLWRMILDQVRSTRGTVYCGRGSTSSVTTRQVAQAAVGAMENGVHGGRYAINSYALSYLEFYTMICEALERDPSDVCPVPAEALVPAMAQLDAAHAASGLEHGIHMVDTARFQDRAAVTDPDECAKLVIGLDDVPAAIRATLAACLV